jgi:hypothetical protein
LHLPVSKLTISRSTANQTNQQAASIHHTQDDFSHYYKYLGGNLSITFQLLNVPTKLNNVKSLSMFLSKRRNNARRFHPFSSDICCGRGKQNWNMTGEKSSLPWLIRASVLQYTAAPSKRTKSVVIHSPQDPATGWALLKYRQQQHNGGGYFYWCDVGCAAARDKVSHSLRDQLTNSALNKRNCYCDRPENKEGTTQMMMQGLLLYFCGL